MNDICLRNELVSRGYIRDYISAQIEQRIKVLEQDYNEEYQRKIPRNIPEGIVFGATSEYDATWETHKVLKNLLRRGLMGNARMPLIVPGTRLRNKYYTKKRYLKLARKHKTRK